MAKNLTESGTTQSAWNQLDQLLTCAICLDRYRNPKLLPCQHTFCMEPCLEGLIDYIRRQIKCPECRAEHRIPYQGIQGYPTNVTLMRFLELHFEVSGETPDPTPTVRERCGVCSEKAYLATCAHCDKKACPDCKEAHLDILKREISRINSQIRRGLHRLQDALCQSEKSVHNLQQNCTNVTQEIDEVYGRLQKDLKERDEVLKNEVQSFLQSELRNLTQLKDNLDVEVANIQSNCELTEKHVSETSEWEDVDLVDYKDTFLKTLEFVRNFDPEQAEFNGRLKFQSGSESDSVHQGIANFGELILNCPQFPANSPVSSNSNLMRSKSDHRLATQFHRQEEARNSYLGVGQRFTGHSSDTESRHDGRSTSPMAGRKFGSDYRRSITEKARDLDDGERFGTKRYGREFGGNWQRDDSSEGGGYRSRFARDDLRESSDPDSHTRSVRFARQEQPENNTPREKIYDSEDAIRGPLSGLPRLADCPKVMVKLQLSEQRQKQKLEEKNNPPPPPPQTPAPTPAPQPQPVRRTQRQLSEDDEIARIKAQNKSQQSASTQTTVTTTSTTTVTTTTTDSSPNRPLSRRVAALQGDGNRPSLQLNRQSSQEETTTEPAGRRKTGSRQDEVNSETSTPARGTAKPQSSNTSSRDSPPSRPPSRQVSRDEYKTPPSTPTRKLSVEQRSDSSKSETDKSPNEESGVASRRRFFTRNQSDSKFDRPNFKGAQSTSISESSKTNANSSESDSERQPSTDNTPVHTATPNDESKGQETPNYFRYRSANSRTSSNSSLDEAGKSPTSPESPLLNRAKPTTKSDVDPSKDRAQSTESSSSGSSSESSNSSPCRTTVSSVPAKPAPPPEEKVDDTRSSRFSSSYRGREPATPSRTVVNDLSKADGRKSPSVSRPTTPSGRSSVLDKYQESKDAKPKFVSRFLPRQSSSTTTDNAKDDSSSESESESELAAKEAARDASITALLARSALARRESTGSGLSTSSVSSRTRDDAGTSSASTRSNIYSRDRDDSTTSSYSRKPTSYLHSRDDKKDTDGAESRYSSLGSSSSSSRYLTRGRSTLDDDKDDSKYGSYASRYLSRSKSSAAIGLDRDGSPDDSSRRTGSDRFRKESRFSALRRNKIGRSRSSHDIALHGDDDDSRDIGTSSYRSSRFDSPSDLARSWSHHSLSREQSPDDTSAAAISSWAKYLKNKYGSKIKEQKALREKGSSPTYNDSSESSDDDGGPLTSIQLGSKVEINGSGYNLNLRVGENPRTLYMQKKHMVMKLGTRGSDPGCFTWPRGIAVGPENSIVVADSSNHRVQVFDSRGDYVKEFGTYGNGEAEFDCLAAVAVNRIGQYIISDRYNHRIQIFDPSGRFLRVFGNQGTSDGRLSYPWGITTDSLGFIYVCDKENHRVQVFQSDGTFVGKFGTAGNKLGQLEHPHYVAVSNTNKVVVSDSNNHRIQVFDVNGRIIFSFGSEGAEEGQFKFPRGVAVDDQGYIIVGDSGNNRIQIFNPDGTFLKSFGAWGNGDDEFKGLEGVAVTSNANILVCDRENHRIQIF